MMLTVQQCVAPVIVEDLGWYSQAHHPTVLACIGYTTVTVLHLGPHFYNKPNRRMHVHYIVCAVLNVHAHVRTFS